MSQSGCPSPMRKHLMMIPFLISGAVLVGAARAESTKFDPGPDAGRGKRVDILDGEVSTREFVRFLADFSGLPVLVSADDAQQLGKPITVAGPIKNADDEIVKALLEVNGWRVERADLPDGKSVIKLSRKARARTTTRRPTTSSSSRSTRRRPTPGTRVTSPTARTSSKRGVVPAAKSREARTFIATGPIFEFGAKGLVAPGGARHSLLAQDLAPESPSTVIVSLAHLKPGDAVGTLLSVLSEPKGTRDFVIAAVKGASKVVLAGRASRVDYALRLLQALDVREEETKPERAVAVFDLENVDVEEVATLIGVFLQPSSHRGRGATHVVADKRTQKLIVEANDPAALEDVRMIIRELDVKLDARRMKTHIYALRHLKAADVAAALRQLLGVGGGRQAHAPRGAPAVLLVPHEETNSLLIQAESNEYAEILHILERIDVARDSAASTSEETKQ